MPGELFRCRSGPVQLGRFVLLTGLIEMGRGPTSVGPPALSPLLSFVVRVSAIVAAHWSAIAHVATYPNALACTRSWLLARIGARAIFVASRTFPWAIDASRFLFPRAPFLCGHQIHLLLWKSWVSEARLDRASDCCRIWREPSLCGLGPTRQLRACSTVALGRPWC